MTSYHGGAFFDAIGNEFDSLDQIDEVISADVLDAWFPPSPEVSRILGQRLDWAMRTSPPTASEGLTNRIAETRGVGKESVLPGAGSSSLIFLAFREWLSAESRILLLEPTYGEYAHVAENVVGCRVDRLTLSPYDGFGVDTAHLEERLSRGYDLAVIVNPNNPTGRHIPRRDLIDVLSRVSPQTLVWVDETYVDYVDAGESLEQFAATSRNVIVSKSMSKVYALSGLRVGYLCGPPGLIDPLRRLTPPWAVSLPGQIAAVMALQDAEYYRQRYDETHCLRERLRESLLALADFRIVPGVANYLLCQLPAGAPTARTFISRCRSEKLFLRDASATAPSLDNRWFRIAVKDGDTNRRMVDIISRYTRKPYRSASRRRNLAK